MIKIECYVCGEIIEYPSTKELLENVNDGTEEFINILGEDCHKHCVYRAIRLLNHNENN
ncbi:MAG: hypothetical protein ACOCP8_05825 [archaeon]